MRKMLSDDRPYPYEFAWRRRNSLRQAKAPLAMEGAHATAGGLDAGGGIRMRYQGTATPAHDTVVVRVLPPEAWHRCVETGLGCALPADKPTVARLR
jgi:hypothetical protein